jgi:hypothetical protein
MATVSLAVLGRTAVLIRRGLTTVVFMIAGLAFAFGFGNGWMLGLALGVPGWIAPLVAPAVDLSVVTLLATIHYLRTRGLGGRLLGPRLLLGCCGLITCALNIARPVLADAVGRACFDAIAPLLLIGWSEVGPRLLALLHGDVPWPDQAAVLMPSAVVGDEDRTVPDRPTLPLDLLARARQLDQAHRASAGRPLTRDQLRSALHVSNALAGALVRHINEIK